MKLYLPENRDEFELGNVVLLPIEDEVVIVVYDKGDNQHLEEIIIRNSEDRENIGEILRTLTGYSTKAEFWKLWDDLRARNTF